MQYISFRRLAPDACVRLRGLEAGQSTLYLIIQRPHSTVGECHGNSRGRRLGAASRRRFARGAGAQIREEASAGGVSDLGARGPRAGGGGRANVRAGAAVS